MNSKWVWRVWFALLAVLVAFGPMLFFYFRQQWARPEYQAFPLIVGAAIVILRMRISEAAEVNRWQKTIALVSFTAVTAGLCLLFLSYLVFSPWLAMAAFIVTNFGLAAKLWQYRKVSGLWGLWATQFLLLPPPLDRDQMLIEYLQLSSSKLTSLVLDGLGVLHLMLGNELRFADRDFFVDEACSGIVSLISILSIIAIYCLWKRYRIGAASLLLASGLFLAVLMNTVRLTLIAVAWYYYKLDLAQGLPHTGVAFVVFALSLGLLLLLAKFAAYWFDPIVLLEEQQLNDAPMLNRLVNFWNTWIANEPEPYEDHEDYEDDKGHEGHEGHATRSTDPLFANGSVFGLPSMSVIALAGLFLGFTYISFENKSVVQVDAALVRALEIQEDLVFAPEDFSQTSFSNDRRELFRWDRWGQYSRTFGFKDDLGFDYVVSCDFMFGPHWHDLRKCYRGTGWKIDQESIAFVTDLGQEEGLAGREIKDSLIPQWTVERFHVQRDDSQQQGYVAFAAFRADGDVFNRPRGDGILANFWAHLVQGRDRAEQADYFQIQVSTFGNSSIDPDQRLRAERLLLAALNRFKAEITTGSGVDSTLVLGN